MKYINNLASLKVLAEHFDVNDLLLLLPCYFVTSVTLLVLLHCYLCYFVTPVTLLPLLLCYLVYLVTCLPNERPN